MPASHRGRKSVAELAAPPLKLLQPQRMKAPPGMAPAAQRIWRMTLESYQPGHFKACDVPLLKIWCTASAMADEAARLIDREGLTISNGRGRMVPNPGVVVLSMCTSMLNSVGTKLRLTVNARMRIDAAATRASAEPDSNRPWAT